MRMRKVIYKILIISILSILCLHTNNTYAVVNNIAPSGNWNKIFQEAYEKKIKNAPILNINNSKEFEKTCDDAFTYIFNKIKKYDKKTLEKFCTDLVKERTKKGPNMSDTVLDMIAGYINQLEKDGKISEDAKAEDVLKNHKWISSETVEENIEDKTTTDQEQIEEITEPNGVGTLKQRDLGLATAKESTAKEYTPNEIIQGADDFLSKGKNDELTYENLQNTSNTVYNILLGVAIVLAVIIGLVLGITFMLSGAAGQAKVKEALVPYIVGCVISFSAFGIWRILIWFLNQV